jgi:hypothetical protein
MVDSYNVKYTVDLTGVTPLEVGTSLIELSTEIKNLNHLKNNNL